MTIPPSDLVLIDTCIWVGFFNRNQSAERITVDPLLDDDRAAITGMILAEILQGFRRDEQADWVASSLKGPSGSARQTDEEGKPSFASAR
jgi:hypothetical protein